MRSWAAIQKRLQKRTPCGVAPGGFLGPFGRPQKFILAALERPWSEKWIDFGLLEGPREDPGGGLGGHLGSFLVVAPAGTKKKADKSPTICFFWSCFFMRFLTAPVCLLVASALAGAKAQLQNMLKTIGFYDIICVYAVGARSANILQTERKSNKQLSKCKLKNTMPRKLEKKPKKSTVWGAKVSPKIDPGGLRERPGRLLRATSAPRALQKRSWRPPVAKTNSKSAPGRKFQRNW